MSFLLGNDWFVIPAIAICVFALVYVTNERIIEIVKTRTIGVRTELIELMEKMMLESNPKKITWLLGLMSGGLGFVFFLLVWPNVIFGVLLGVLVATIGLQLPRIYFRSMWEKRCNRIVAQMVDGMTIMANGIQAGLSVTQSMERVIANVGGPLGQEFNLVLNKIRLGMSVEIALNEMGDRIPRQDVTMFVSSVNILKETGGNLAETFNTIVQVVRERQKVEKKIEAMTAQGIMQGVIISCIPFAILGIFLVVDPAYVMPLFTRPLGWFFLLLMVGLIAIGGLLIRKLVTIKV
jgi:tight adherence protein B